MFSTRNFLAATRRLRACIYDNGFIYISVLSLNIKLAKILITKFGPNGIRSLGDSICCSCLVSLHSENIRENPIQILAQRDLFSIFADFNIPAHFPAGKLLYFS